MYSNYHAAAVAVAVAVALAVAVAVVAVGSGGSSGMHADHQVAAMHKLSNKVLQAATGIAHLVEQVHRGVHHQQKRDRCHT